jgi:endonuclease III
VKTAKCVLMYSLGRDVLPIDIHVLRVAKRLGLVATDASWDAVDRQLEAEVPAELKFDVHVGFVIHGREVCRSRDPDCDDCVLADLCPSAFDPPRLRSDYL